MDKEQERVDFIWRYQPLKSTPDGVLMSHVKYNPLMPSREMILQALRPYWLPLAYQEKGGIDPVFLERLFRNAVYALSKHALYLCDQAGIDYPLNFIGGTSIRKTPLLLDVVPQVGGAGRLMPDGGRSTTVSSNFIAGEFSTDDLFESVGGDDFDDSGFS